MSNFLALLKDEAGGTMVEYAIVAGLIVVPLLGIGVAIANGSGSTLTATTSSMQTLGTTPP